MAGLTRGMKPSAKSVDELKKSRSEETQKSLNKDSVPQAPVKTKAKGVLASTERKMVRKTFDFDDALWERARKFGFENKCKDVEVAREALEFYLSEKGY